MLEGDLPGEIAHAVMSPKNRPTLEQVISQGINARVSAVLILLYPKNGEWNVVMIKRNEYAGTHSAQVSFPGGRKDDADESLLHTALRETYEELGIKIPHGNVIGALSTIYIPPSNFLVSPYIAFYPEYPAFNPDPREVNYFIEFPIMKILDESIVKTTIVDASSGLRLNVPYFDISNEIVWGATAIILSELKMLLRNIN